MFLQCPTLKPAVVSETEGGSFSSNGLQHSTAGVETPVGTVSASLLLSGYVDLKRSKCCILISVSRSNDALNNIKMTESLHLTKLFHHNIQYEHKGTINPE